MGEQQRTIPASASGADSRLSSVEVHALLLTCVDPLTALREFGEAVAVGEVRAIATVIYTGRSPPHEGKGAHVRPYWRRIDAAGQLGALWSQGTVDLPPAGTHQPVRLTAMTFDEAEVRAFVAQRRPVKPQRGRRRVQDEWTPFWLVVAKLAKRGLLNRGNYSTKAKLLAEIHTQMGATLDDQTIKPFVALGFVDKGQPQFD